MTPTAIAQAAARNRANRLQQIERLQPLRHLSQEKRTALRQAQAGAASVQESLALMSSLRYVPNFFPTPPAVVRALLEQADICAGHSVLEPSAGKGDLVKAALALGASVRGYELNGTLAEHCRKQGYDIAQADFLTVSPFAIFDRVVMNPPFERGIDAAHIRHAARFLRPGGRLVSVACSTTGAKLANDFGIIPLPAGSFKTADRPTAVNTCLVCCFA